MCLQFNLYDLLKNFCLESKVNRSFCRRHYSTTSDFCEADEDTWRAAPAAGGWCRPRGGTARRNLTGTWEDNKTGKKSIFKFLFYTNMRKKVEKLCFVFQGNTSLQDHHSGYSFLKGRKLGTGTTKKYIIKVLWNKWLNIYHVALKKKDQAN